MDTTAAKSQAQSMRSSIVSFQMTPDLTARLDWSRQRWGDGRGTPTREHTNRGEKERVVMVVVVEDHQEGETIALQETGTTRSIELVPIARPENWHE